MKTSLAAQLVDAEVIQFGKFTLKSGKESPIYLDLRILVSHPQLLKQIAIALNEKSKTLSFDRIAAIPYAALPIGTALSLESGKPMIYTRKETKQYGTKKMIEGEYVAGETVLVLDDLITTGLSKTEAIQPLIEAGLKVNDILVVIDRQQQGAHEMEKNGIRLHALLTIRELIDELYNQQKITTAQKKEVDAFLANEK